MVALRELQQKIRPGEIVAIGCGAQRNPLQFAGGHNNAALLADQLSEVRIVLHIVNNDRGAEDKSWCRAWARRERGPATSWNEVGRTGGMAAGCAQRSSSHAGPAAAIAAVALAASAMNSRRVRI
jgi:hypothetical protein